MFARNDNVFSMFFVKNFNSAGGDTNAVLSVLSTAKAMAKSVRLAYYDEGNAGAKFDVNNVGQTLCSIRWVMLNE